MGVLTNHQLIEEGIITNVTEECMGAPAGIDLQVESISRIVGMGFIPEHGKTQLPTYEPLAWGEDGCLILQPGMHEVIFKQGCNFPNNVIGKITHRSSVLRSGGNLTSAIFDSGFHTDKMGSFMQVVIPLKIERGARLAQINCYRTEQPAELYNGQWQGDKQRKIQESVHSFTDTLFDPDLAAAFIKKVETLQKGREHDSLQYCTK